jgi:type II secretory pathway pseudopilin PulG
MNRDLQKLLQEKWFLVAADFIAVLGVLCLGLDPKDGFQAFLAVLGILGASLIIVIPVLQDGGGKAERLAEQARLRAALAAEIDRLRDDARSAAEAANRRLSEVELDGRRQAEAAVAAVAQRASSEINALKAAVAELEKKVAVAQRSAAVGAEAKEAADEIAAKLESLAETVRGALATTEETAEALAELKAAAPAVGADDLKAVRDELKKSAQKAANAADKLEERLEGLAAELQGLRDRPNIAPAAPADDEADEEPVKEEEEDEAEEAASDEPAAAPAAAPVVSAGGTALVINLMIGIGNKPYVRGSGPGLSADQGVPMSFLGIGRWQWVSPQPDAPATVEVWKNDESPLGEPIHLSGGEIVELDEGHFTGA